MPRDDLTIAAHFPNMPPGMPDAMGSQALDPLTVLEDFISRSANLPAEIAYMREEMEDKERQLTLCLDQINLRDNAIQKFIKTNGSVQQNPKQARMVKEVSELYDKAQLLQEEKCALALKTQQIVDRQVRFLDIQLAALHQRGDFPEDSDLPSLLRPAPEPARPLSAQALAQAQAAAAASGRNLTPTQAQTQRAAQGLGHQGQVSSAPGTPAAALLLQRQQREGSTGAGSANKRQRTGLGLNIPAQSSNLARHSSTGPATPKGIVGTPRAGSAGPGARGQTQKVAASGKKVAPHQQAGIKLNTGGAQKSKLGKSGLSRVKGARSGNKASPSAASQDQDSELSDAESGHSEVHTPPPAGNRHEEDMDDDEGSDDRKYCMCQKVSYGDMVACDNPDCQFEWFHWPCVGLTKEPVGQWICPPCSERMRDSGQSTGRKR